MSDLFYAGDLVLCDEFEGGLSDGKRLKHSKDGF